MKKTLVYKIDFIFKNQIILLLILRLFQDLFTLEGLSADRMVL